MKGINASHLQPLSDYDYEFGSMQSHGVKYVRISFKYYIDGEVNKPALMEMVAAAARYGIKIILSMPNKESWPTLTPYTADQIRSFWTQVISIGDIFAVYELCNEPKVDGWWELQDELYHTLRRFTNKPIIITGPRVAWTFDEPLPYYNVLYSFHDYNHFPFTHQGIGDFPLVPDMVYPGHEGWSGLTESVITWNDKREHFQKIRDFQLKYNVPIFIGEFSAVNDAVGGDEWVRDSIDLFNEYGWSWMYYSWRNAEWSYTGWEPSAERMAILSSGW